MIYAGYKKHPLGDEQYTPRHAVLPIIKYLPRKAVVWCPFDTEERSRMWTDVEKFGLF